MIKEAQHAVRGYELRFEHRADYLVAYVSGDTISVPMVLGYLAEIANECRARHYKRVLVIDSLDKKLSLLDKYELGNRVNEAGVRGITIAYVDLEPEHYADNQFAETVAVTRGAFGKVFASLPAAEQWLTSLPSP